MKINLKKGQNLWFTSDLHLNHRNICMGESSWGEKESVRDFFSVRSMNDTIVGNINSVVAENDWLFMLGDVAFGDIPEIVDSLSQIKCRNKVLVYGNHDFRLRGDMLATSILFKRAEDKLLLTVTSEGLFSGKKRFVLSHMPFVTWDNIKTGRMHLFGHLHLPPNKKLMEGKSMDVGVDGNDLKPYSIMDVCELLEQRPVAITRLNPDFDHHLKSDR